MDQPEWRAAVECNKCGNTSQVVPGVIDIHDLLKFEDCEFHRRLALTPLPNPRHPLPAYGTYRGVQFGLLGDRGLETVDILEPMNGRNTTYWKKVLVVKAIRSWDLTAHPGQNFGAGDVIGHHKEPHPLMGKYVYVPCDPGYAKMTLAKAKITFKDDEIVKFGNVTRTYKEVRAIWDQFTSSLNKGVEQAIDITCRDNRIAPSILITIIYNAKQMGLPQNDAFLRLKIADPRIAGQQYLAGKIAYRGWYPTYWIGKQKFESRNGIN